MAAAPEFPTFVPLRLEDRPLFEKFFGAYGPDTSELTFTNLFIWRGHYGIKWSVAGEHLLILCAREPEPCYVLMPVGPSPRIEITRRLLAWLKDSLGVADPKIERADGRLAGELRNQPGVSVEPTREHFDYVYRTEDLIRLTGKKFDGKRNHLRRFTEKHDFKYLSGPEGNLRGCFDLAERWCQARACADDLGLSGEWEAVREALLNHEALGLRCGAIEVGGRVAAFTLGELLNPQTAVVHIEKADPDIQGLYPLINQQFCERGLSDVPWVNREQDLGEDGLRRAKQSYHPDHLVEKFRIRHISH
jgi:hypothetical protein